MLKLLYFGTVGVFDWECHHPFTLTFSLQLFWRPYQAVCSSQMSLYIELTTGLPAETWFSLQQKGFFFLKLVYVFCQLPFAKRSNVSLINTWALIFSTQVVPLQMCIKCNIAGIQIDNQQITSIVDASRCTSESTISEVIW